MGVTNTKQVDKHYHTEKIKRERVKSKGMTTRALPLNFDDLERITDRMD